MPTTKPLSLCICTFNRSEQLRLTLHSLVNCSNELDDADEILVIDNNSTDATKQVTDDFKDKLPIKYLFESAQGLSHARNTALKTFTSNFVVFIDDDITVLPGLITAYRVASQNNTDAYFFGGRISVDWKNKRPTWLVGDQHPLLNGLFCHYNINEGAQYKDKHNPLLPYGANFALRRSLISEVGLFDVDLGVSGKSILRGEETNYFHRSLDSGHIGHYLNDAHVLHRFDQERLSIPYLYKYGISKGVSEVYLGSKPTTTLIRPSLFHTLKAANQLRKGRRDRFYECIINLGILRGLYKAKR